MNNIFEKLQSIQDREINFSISCFYDNLWTIKLGDEINGFLIEETEIMTFIDACERIIKLVEEYYKIKIQ